MRRLILISFSLLFTNLHSQDLMTFGNDSHDYDLGIKYLQQKKYKMADSTLTKYLNSRLLYATFTGLIPLNDILFNIGIAKLGQKDTCSFCDKLHESSIFNDNEALKKYYKICANSIDSVFLDKNLKLVIRNKAKYLIITYYDKFKKYRIGRVLDLKLNEQTSHFNTLYENKGKMPFVQINSLGSSFENKTFVNSGKIVGMFKIENGDTTYTLIGKSFVYYKNYGIKPLPNVQKWNKTYDAMSESNLKYPEDKEEAYKKYQSNQIFLFYNVITNPKGKIEKIVLLDSDPKSVSKEYTDESLRFIESTSDYIVPQNIFNKNVRFETIFYIKFKFR